MYRRSRILAWLLAVVFLVCSCCSGPVCSSRPLAAAADGGDVRKTWDTAAATGVAATAGSTGNNGARRGGRRKFAGSRRRSRSLGDRSPWMPPPPLSNKPRGMEVPAPPAP